MCVCMCVCVYIYVCMCFFILHVPLLVVILHAFFHIYNYCTMFINIYNYCYILRWFGFFNVASNFVKRKCVYKFNKKIDNVSLLIVFYLLTIYLFFLLSKLDFLFLCLLSHSCIIYGLLFVHCCHKRTLVS